MVRIVPNWRIEKLNQLVSKKTILTQYILMVLGLRQTDIGKELHLSQGQISKIIAGEQKNPYFDKWLMEKLQKEYCN